MRACRHACSIQALALWLVVFNATLPGYHAALDPELQAMLDEEAAYEDEEEDGFSLEEGAQKSSDKSSDGPKKLAMELLELTESNFDDAIIKYDYVIVKFYYPEDERCQEFIGPYEEAAVKLLKRDPPVLLAQVNAREEHLLVDTYGLNLLLGKPQMPTFHAFAFGQHQRYFTIYTKPLTTQAVVQKINKITTEHAKEQSLYVMEPWDKSSLQRYIAATKESDVAIIFRGYKNSAKTLTFKKAVKDWIAPYKDVCKIRCAIVNVTKKDGIKMSMLRPGFSGVDTSEVEYTGKWETVAIGRWAKKSTYPTIGHKFSINKYGWSALNELFLEASVVVLLGEEAVGLEACKVVDSEGVCASGQEESLKPKVLGSEGEEASEQGAVSMWRSHFTTAWQDISSKYPLWRFVVTSVADVSTSELEILGWRNNSEVMVTVLKEKRRYILTDPEQLQRQFGLHDWLADVAAGYVPPHWKTEATEEGEPTEVAEGILVLRGDTFEEYALDPSMDVLVLFTHTGCQVCEDVIEPVLRALHERLEEQLWKSGVELAKFNALKNECLEDVPTVPKLVIYPAVSADRKMKARQVYPGLWELEPITEFLVKYSKNIKEAHWFEQTKKKGSAKVEEKVLKEKHIPQDRRRRTVD